eukprot:s514_g13.t1
MWFLSYLEVASLPTVGCLSMDLHDDVLEEALADRADLTGPAPLTPLSAAESLAPDADPTEPRRGPPPPLPVNWRPRMGPSGPPAPMPYNCTVETQTALNMVNWPLPSLTADDAGETALVPVSISGRMGTEGDEDAVRRMMSRHMADHSGVEGVNQLHAALFQACCQVFPARAAPPREKPWQTLDVQVGVRELWATWRAFKQVRKAGLRGWFLAWRAWKNYDRQHREHQRRCKQARKHKLLEAVTEAQTCAYKHDARGLYQVIKRLAPKQSYRRLQLRDDAGTMLTPLEEADLLQKHFRARFQALAPKQSYRRLQLRDDAGTMLTPLEEADLLQKHFRARFQAEPLRANHSLTHGAAAPLGPWTLQAVPQLDATTLCLALQAIPRRKAVPVRHPPGAAWRLCADMVAPWVCRELTRSWSTVPLAVPGSWSDVDLALILKPDKLTAALAVMTRM